MTLTDRVEKYFRERPGQWIHFSQLSQIGGIGGWRTRVSECRTERGMKIDNRQERNGIFTDSYYRFTPEREQGELF